MLLAMTSAKSLDDKDHLRVLHMDTGAEFRGGQIQVFALIEKLASLGVENHLLVTSPSPLADRIEQQGLDASLHRMRGRGYLEAALEARRLHADLKLDLAHAHDSRAHTIACLASIRGGLPPLIVTRRMDRRHPRNPLRDWKYRRPARWIAVSSAVERALIDQGVAASRIEKVPSGIDLEGAVSCPADLSRIRAIGLDPDRPMICCVGALSPEKDHFTLISAAKELHEDRPDLQYVILGEGPLRGKLEAAIDEADLSSVFFLPGFEQSVPSILKACDLFVMPSLFEGLGGAILQAIACGVPVVASRIPGFEDLVSDGKTGALFEPGASSELARVIRRYLDDPAPFRAMAKSARSILEEYDSAVVARRILDVYRLVICGRISKGEPRG